MEEVRVRRSPEGCKGRNPPRAEAGVFGAEESNCGDPEVAARLVWQECVQLRVLRLDRQVEAGRTGPGRAWQEFEFHSGGRGNPVS